MMKKYKLTYEELKDLLIKAGKNGFNSYEINEAGLEPYDAEAEAIYIILSLKSQSSSRLRYKKK